MESLGEIFKSARDAKKMSISEAAAATRIMRHQLEAMEEDNWSKIPAPAYAKGFIKIYAQKLNLDPAPLIRQYVEQYVNPPPAVPEPVPAPAAETLPDPGRAQVEPPGEEMPAVTLNPERVKQVVYVGAALLLLFFLGLFSVRGCAKLKAGKTEKPVSDLITSESGLVTEPPEPYLDIE